MKRIKVVYRDRQFIDRYTCRDYPRTLYANSMFQSGGLTYFRVDEFNYKVIENYLIDSIEGV